MNSSEVIRASGIAFGTSGARGLVSAFSDDVCRAFATAFVAVMARCHAFDRVALGIDLRPSSPQMAAACAAAITATGRQVDYYGVLPTPALAFQSMRGGVPAIMVSGSHIPFDRNGLKFYRPDGEIGKADEQDILGADCAFTPGPASGLPPVSEVASMAYLRRYLDFFPAGMLAGWRVGHYQHSASGRDLFERLLRELGAEVVVLERTEHFVPIDTEAVSATDQALARQWSADHGLDAIVSTDGDGDRPLLADERGNWLRGDIVGLLASRYLGIEALAVPVSCNTAIESCGSFARVLRTRIGSPFVIEGMASLAAGYARVGGFEANGGYLLGSRVSTGVGAIAPLPTRDAVLPALALMAAANAHGRRLSELVAALPARFTTSDRLKDFPTERSRELLAQWESSPRELLTAMGLAAELRSIDRIDGLRLVLVDGRIVHLRPSGNAPELRCYAEADSADAAAALVEAALRAAGAAS